MTTAVSAFRAAGATDVGRQRDVNEDRFHIDREHGVFMVIDGVGGQAAGGRAADTALEMIRARLARETGSLPDRIREAITWELGQGAGYQAFNRGLDVCNEARKHRGSLSANALRSRA